MRASASIVPIVAWLLLAGGQVEAQIYKWVDEKGTVHFSQSPPAGGAGSGVVEAIPDAPAAPMVQGGPEPAADDDQGEVVDGLRQREPDPVEDEGGEDEYAPEEDAGPTDVIVDDGTQDPRVRLRGRLPANEPGQPIRQPGAGAVPRRGGRR